MISNLIDFNLIFLAWSIYMWFCCEGKRWLKWFRSLIIHWSLECSYLWYKLHLMKLQFDVSVKYIINICGPLGCQTVRCRLIGVLGKCHRSRSGINLFSLNKIKLETWPVYVTICGWGCSANKHTVKYECDEFGFGLKIPPNRNVVFFVVDLTWPVVACIPTNSWNV